MMAHPVLDASGQEFDILMTEGDPINFQWIVPGSAAWAGSYTFKVRVSPSLLISIACTVTTTGLASADAFFAVVAAAQVGLISSTSGYLWSIKDNAGPTRFGGLLFVEDAV